MMPKLPPPYGVLHGVQVWHGDDLLAYGHAVAEAKDAEIAELRAERERDDVAFELLVKEASLLRAERDALLVEVKAYKDAATARDRNEDSMRAERDALRADAERRLQLLRIVKESIGITNADAAKYDFAKFAEHKPDCGSPRGDQACQCGYSSVRFNIEALLEECNSDVEGATMNSVAADIDAALAAKEEP